MCPILIYPSTVTAATESSEHLVLPHSGLWYVDPVYSTYAPVSHSWCLCRFRYFLSLSQQRTIRLVRNCDLVQDHGNFDAMPPN